MAHMPAYRCYMPSVIRVEQVFPSKFHFMRVGARHNLHDSPKLNVLRNNDLQPGSQTPHIKDQVMGKFACKFFYI